MALSHSYCQRGVVYIVTSVQVCMYCMYRSILTFVLRQLNFVW